MLSRILEVFLGVALMLMINACTVRVGEPEPIVQPDPNATGTIQGQVYWEDSSQTPVTVYAWLYGSLMASADVDASGQFEMDKLPRGSYKLMARDSLDRYTFIYNLGVAKNNTTQTELTIPRTYTPPLKAWDISADSAWLLWEPRDEQTFENYYSFCKDPECDRIAYEQTYLGESWYYSGDYQGISLYPFDSLEVKSNLYNQYLTEGALYSKFQFTLYDSYYADQEILEYQMYWNWNNVRSVDYSTHRELCFTYQSTDTLRMELHTDSLTFLTFMLNPTTDIQITKVAFSSMLMQNNWRDNELMDVLGATRGLYLIIKSPELNLSAGDSAVFRAAFKIYRMGFESSCENAIPPVQDSILRVDSADFVGIEPIRNPDFYWY